MKTPLQVLETIRDRLSKAHNNSKVYHSNDHGYEDEIKKLRQEISYSVDLLTTLIEIEEGDIDQEDEGNELLP